MLTKQEILSGKGTLVESSRVREPRRTTLPHGWQFYGDGISFQVVFSQSFWLRVLPGGARLVQPRWMPERRILGGGRTCGVSFWPFLNSSGWWWLISSVFLIRISCHKTTHANSYYGAWPGWAVSVSVLPLAILLFHSTWHPICFSHHHLVPQLLPLGYALNTLLSAIPFPLQWQQCSSVWKSPAWISMLITSDMHQYCF